MLPPVFDGRFWSSLGFLQQHRSISGKKSLNKNAEGFSCRVFIFKAHVPLIFSPQSLRIMVFDLPAVCFAPAQHKAVYGDRHPSR